jgi:hypothetical protein
MVPSRAFSASSSGRASDGGALESNGIIVGNKNEFKEVSNQFVVVPAGCSPTLVCSTQNGAKIVSMRATSSWLVAASLW